VIIITPLYSILGGEKMSNDNELRQAIYLNIEEINSLNKEIDTLKNDINRKANVIVGLYNVILKTGDINLIAEAGVSMRDNG